MIVKKDNYCTPGRRGDCVLMHNDRVRHMRAAMLQGLFADRRTAVTVTQKEDTDTKNKTVVMRATLKCYTVLNLNVLYLVPFLSSPLFFIVGVMSTDDAAATAVFSNWSCSSRGRYRRSRGFQH
mmetsp:Transcript_2680/g.3903  ORF Transcript_2680/g.3903 Transcript_2680/m.3903 type:complete len:124 (-) Transcript_2680:410-781(-)